MYTQWDARPRASDTVFKINAFFVFSFIVEELAYLLQIFGVLKGRPIDFLYTLSLQWNQNFNPITIFTHPLVHSDLVLPWALFTLLFQIMIFYFFGSELERIWGAYPFLKFFLFGILGGVVLGYLVSYLPMCKNYRYYGLAGASSAILVAYTMFWPNREILFMFFLPLKMKWFTLLIFLLLLLSGGYVALIQYSGGAIASALFLYYYASGGSSKKSLFKLDIGGNDDSLRGGFIQKWKEYKHKKKMKVKQAEINKRIEMKNKVDALLGKISKEGIESLSKKEKVFLDKASKEI